MFWVRMNLQAATSHNQNEFVLSEMLALKAHFGMQFTSLPSVSLQTA